MNTSTPSVSKLMMPTIDVIEKLGGSAKNEDIVAGLLKMGFEHGTSHAGGPRSELEYRAAWARSYLKIYGGLENPTRGTWTITEKGKLIKEADIQGIVNSVVSESRKLRPGRQNSKQKIRRKRLTRQPEPALTDTGVSAIDQARTIISLFEKGILPKVAANTALKRLGGF